MGPDAVQENALDSAARRLTRALGRLDQRLGTIRAAAPVGPAASDEDRARLAAELGAAQARAAELEAAAEDAGRAVERAVADIRFALTAVEGAESEDGAPDESEPEESA